MSTLSLYSSATGMEAQQLNLNTIANNIANVNTTGFKRSKIEFVDLLYQNPKAIGGESGNGSEVPTGVQMGNGTQVASTSKVFTQGQINQTGGELDIAIEGVGFFEVEKPDGTLAYTRDGALKINSDGQVVTNAGFPVSGFDNIPADTLQIFVAPTGEVTVQTPNGSQTFEIQLARFSNPSGLKSLGGNLYEVTDASGEAELGNPGKSGYGSLLQGFLESSNVNVVEEMVNMIIAQRSYELNSKSIQTSDEMMSRVSQLKR